MLYKIYMLFNTNYMYTMLYNILSPDLQFLQFSVLQRKATIFDARTRAAQTLKRHRDERGADYDSRRSQDASDGSASD